MTENTHKPKVSVVMSINNEPLQWIRLAVESILSQTFRDFEFIIVCDNPSYKEGIAYINSASKDDSRIISIMNESNLGPTKSFNKAIEVASGRYIARMDADDIAFPERFEKQTEFLDEHPEVSVCATDVHIIDKEGRITRKNKYRNKHSQALNVIFNSMAHPSIMLRRCLLEERTPIYNEDYIYSQDYELWTFLIMRGHKFHTIDKPLLFYRKSSYQISSAKRQQQSSLFKKAHKKFITDWLTSRSIITDKDSKSLETMLGKASKALKRDTIAIEDREYLTLIVYVLYFSMGTYSWAWRFRYLFDGNMIVFKIPFIYTFRLFVSSKTRKNRTGFN